MTSVVPIDSNALVAAVDVNDSSHDSVLRVMADRRHEFVIPTLCVAEGTFLS